MTSIPAARPDGLPPVHPGEILVDIIAAMPEGKAAFARALGVSRPALYNILEGRNAITAAMALRLGKVLGNEPQFWLNLQSQYDLKVARAELGDKLDAVTALPKAAVV